MGARKEGVSGLQGLLPFGHPLWQGQGHVERRGQKIEIAPPSTPVEVVGFSDVPEAGETFIVVPDERTARQISLHRQEKLREKELSKLSKVSLEELYDQIKKGEVKELNVIIKADVQGSIEAMREALKKLSTDTVKVNILHEGVGGITETDVNLASASNAIIIGFNVRPVTKPRSLPNGNRWMSELIRSSMMPSTISKRPWKECLNPPIRNNSWEGRRCFRSSSP